MTTTIDATFDPESKWRPIEEGVYPAHIATVSHRELDTRAGEAIVVNMTYKVDGAVKHTDQPLWKMDGYKYVKDTNGNRIPQTVNGEQTFISCEHLKDRIFKDNGWFIFTSSSSSSKNARYFELLDNLGIKCKEEQVNGKSTKRLVLLEETDVVGLPVHVTVSRKEFVTAETKHLPPSEQEKRHTFEVIQVKPWENGERLSSDEVSTDVPF
jgi:hypothetical protein